MAIYYIKAFQKIPGSLQDVWSFFSKPDNLKDITPPQLKFNVISKYQGDSIYAGQLIEYKVSPLFGISLYWMTEITHVKDSVYFVDEQRYGPYSMWHHQHHFKSIEGGVEMTDIVHYKIPFWFFGDIVNTLFVRKQLKGIFAFRYKKTAEVFGEFAGEKPLLRFS
jgi:ligand-binding SRPBCC domain-containing protein